jgi:hypothetical protein
MTGVVGWGSVLVPVGLTAGFLVMSAAAARQERARRWPDEPVARRVSDARVSDARVSDGRVSDDRREVPTPRTVSRHAMPARAARTSVGGTYDAARVAGRDTTWSTPAARGVRETERQAGPSFDQARGRDLTVETPRKNAAAYEPSVPSVPTAPTAETPVPVEPGRVSLGPSVPSGELWDPVRVPLPTYVTKAKAPRTVRTVDLAQSGIWAAAGTPADGLLTRPDDAPKMLLDESGSGDRSDADRRARDGDQDSGDTDRLLLVVRDEEGRGPGRHQDRAKVSCESLAQRPVECAERLVEQQQSWLHRQRPGERDALPLAARQGGR